LYTVAVAKQRYIREGGLEPMRFEYTIGLGVSETKRVGKYSHTGNGKL